MIGAVTRWAAAATATASEAMTGKPIRAKDADHPGAINSSPVVAATDNTNPRLADRSGLASSTARTVAARIGNAARCRPVANPPSARSAIAAARTTLGDGRARTTKATTAKPPRTAIVRGDARARRKAKLTQPMTIERLVPDTATRWVSPATRKRSCSTGSSWLVSPSTRPGSSPRGNAGNPADARRRPARTDPAAPCHHGGRPRIWGLPRAVTVAAVRSPPRGGFSRPSTRTR